ncbi:hypothetical protein ACPYO6_15025 [Georgenia sp. Z1344]|uniref:hypothetical protein n=1 Tax=Georgenia sp. Z1344 TaxID=3416706 RepID=UPI003CE68F94
MLPGSALEDFPVVNKAYLRDHTDDLVSSQFSVDDLVTASTSGSTGTPLRVLQDRGKRFWRNAETIYFGAEVGFDVGMRLYNLKVWSERNRQPRWRHLIRNTRPVDVVKLSDDQIARFISELAELKQPAAIISYASALDQIAAYVTRTPDCPQVSKVQSIIAQSEPLSEETRNRMGAHFGVLPVSRYGMEEVGVIGQESVGGVSGYRLNRSGVVVEVLDNNADVPAGPGEVGRIVVTDLRNYGMPIIRYDTGDVGRFAVKDTGEPDTSRLASIEGRFLDRITDASGNHVSPFVFYKSVWKYPEIRQFQLAQTAHAKYELRLQVDAPLADEAQIARDFTEHLGSGADFEVRYVDDFPVLKSGKRRQVVNESRAA